MKRIHQYYVTLALLLVITTQHLQSMHGDTESTHTTAPAPEPTAANRFSPEQQSYIDQNKNQENPTNAHNINSTDLFDAKGNLKNTTQTTFSEFDTNGNPILPDAQPLIDLSSLATAPPVPLNAPQGDVAQQETGDLIGNPPTGPAPAIPNTALPDGAQQSSQAAGLPNEQVNEIAPVARRSTLQALSNKVFNATSSAGARLGLSDGTQKNTVTDPVSGTTTVTTTDAKRNLVSTKVTAADGSYTIQDAQGNPVEVSKIVNGTTITTQYDSNGKPTLQSEVTSNTATGRTVGRNNATATTTFFNNGKPTTTTVKDSSGKLITTKSFSGDGTSYKTVDINNKTVETKNATSDGGYEIKNSTGQVTERLTIDPSTQDAITTVFNKSEDSSDKSSIKTITNPKNPEITQTITNGTDGNPTKIEIANSTTGVTTAIDYKSGTTSLTLSTGKKVVINNDGSISIDGLDAKITNHVSQLASRSFMQRITGNNKPEIVQNADNSITINLNTSSGDTASTININSDGTITHGDVTIASDLNGDVEVSQKPDSNDPIQENIVRTLSKNGDVHMTQGPDIESFGNGPTITNSLVDGKQTSTITSQDGSTNTIMTYDSTSNSLTFNKSQSTTLGKMLGSGNKNQMITISFKDIANKMTNATDATSASEAIDAAVSSLIKSNYLDANFMQTPAFKSFQQFTTYNFEERQPTIASKISNMGKRLLSNVIDISSIGLKKADNVTQTQSTLDTHTQNTQNQIYSSARSAGPDGEIPGQTATMSIDSSAGNGEMKVTNKIQDNVIINSEINNNSEVIVNTITDSAGKSMGTVVFQGSAQPDAAYVLTRSDGSQTSISSTGLVRFTSKVKTVDPSTSPINANQQRTIDPKTGDATTITIDPKTGTPTIKTIQKLDGSSQTFTADKNGTFNNASPDSNMVINSDGSITVTVFTNNKALFFGKNTRTSSSYTLHTDGTLSTKQPMAVNSPVDIITPPATPATPPTGQPIAGA